MQCNERVRPLHAPLHLAGSLRVLTCNTWGPSCGSALAPRCPCAPAVVSGNVKGACRIVDPRTPRRPQHDAHQISNFTLSSGMVLVKNAAPTVEACSAGPRDPDPVGSLKWHTRVRSAAGTDAHLEVEELSLDISQHQAALPAAHLAQQHQLRHGLRVHLHGCTRVWSQCCSCVSGDKYRSQATAALQPWRWGLHKSQPAQRCAKGSHCHSHSSLHTRIYA